MPEFELADAGESIDEFEAKLRHTPDGSGEGRQKRPKTEDHLAIRPSDARSERVTKKPRACQTSEAEVWEDATFWGKSRKENASRKQKRKRFCAGDHKVPSILPPSHSPHKSFSTEKTNLGNRPRTPCKPQKSRQGWCQMWNRP
jgi:hypothetical protein